MTAEQLRDCALEALASRKGRNILALDVADLTDLADFMIFATGSSARHVGALAEQVVAAVKRRSHPLLGLEGKDACEWVLLDLGDVLVHVMQAATREFYDLESLWRPLPADST